MKILIIGQAPPAVNQVVPYDTTMLYDILSWVGVSKIQAQNIFEFEAVYSKFPGYSENGGHLKPTNKQMLEHWNNVLENKVILADKIIILGKVASIFFNSQPKRYSCNTQIIELIHPSRRNYNKIMANSTEIIQKLNKILQ